MVFEPLLERVSMFSWGTVPDWTLIGGEIGTWARPCNMAWIHELLIARSTPHYVMSLGNNAVRGDGERILLKSRTASSPFEWPQEVQVQELPWGDEGGT
jgi:protein gp37